MRSRSNPWRERRTHVAGASRSVFACFALMCGVASGASAVDCLDYTETMHWTGGIGTPAIDWVRDVEVRFPFVYAVARGGSSDGLHVIDVSDPEHPRVVAYVPHGSHSCITLRDDYAYVGGGDFHVFDISDPTDPVQVGYNEVGGSDIALEGAYAYLVSHNGFAVIDVSIPESPVFITYEWAETGCEGIAVRDDVVYIGRSIWIDVFDVSDKENPAFVRSVEVGTDTNYVRIHDGVLFASGFGHFTSLDISDRLDPQVMYSLSIPVVDARFAIQGTVAHVVDGTIRNIDISDPMYLSQISHYTIGIADCVAVSGDYAYAGVGLGFNVVALPGLDVATLVGKLSTASPVYDVAASGDLGCLATYTGGLETVDLSAPENPLSLGITPTNGFAWGVDLAGETVYVADGPAGLSIYDLSSPGLPELIGSLDLAGQALHVRVQDGVAFVAAGYQGLVLIDVSDPTSPELLGAVDTPESANRVEVWGDWALVSGGSTGLHIIDVSELTSPVLQATVAGSSNDAAFVPPYVFLIDRTVGLRIVDISIPEDPTEVSTVFLPYAGTSFAPMGVGVDGRMAYVASHAMGLFVIDVADPEAPRLLGNLDTYRARDVRVHRDYVLIADEAGGLEIAPLQCSTTGVAWTEKPTVPKLHVYPNPVTASSQIRFDLRESGLVALDLFAVSGRRVAQVQQGELRAGEQQIYWRDLSVPAVSGGKYYLRLRCDGTFVSSTPVIVR